VIDSHLVTERLADALAGKHVLLTGATGFVGEATLERILSDLPDTTVTILVRGRDGQPASARVDALLAKSAFAGLRDRLGDDGFAELRTRRLRWLEGDLVALPALPADLDVVIHCAGEVSFDPAIDEGFATNLHGSLALLAAVAASGSHPHYVHVSTAYVAGRRQGWVPEGRLDHGVDWRVESQAASRIRPRVDDASRSPHQLAAFLKAAEAEHSRTGPSTVAVGAERRRLEWVDQQLVAAGRERALTLGWTDCYTFTKAMAERAVEEAAVDLPLTIVRPSIIESALQRPFPGWIEGFKMAEPLILAYGRGDIPDFPGNPDGVIDIIPIDLVVNALLAAAATPPPVGRPSYFTVCSARNPLTFHTLYTLTREHFTDEPVVQRDRGAVRVPSWRWRDRAQTEQLLGLGERLHGTADRLVSALPRSPRTRSWARSLDRRKRQLEFFRRYLELFAPYASGALHFSDAATLSLHESLHPADKQAFGFDAAIIDWPHYFGKLHVPTVAAPLRLHEATSGVRADVIRGTPQPDSGGSVVAVFDMDGTLLASNVVTSYLSLRLPELRAAGRLRELGEVARSAPAWLSAERHDRGSLLRSVYQRYRGATLEGLERIVDDELTSSTLQRLSPGAVRAIKQHRAAGHRVVLVTGAIEPLTRPFAPLFDEIAAARLAIGPDGRCTGHLELPPLVGEARAAWLVHRASVEGWDLTRSWAYADSISDLPLLRAVGNPVAVDPDVALTRAARRQRWPIETWSSTTPPRRDVVAAR
jgi:HAD superfamily hydrolase (TIGR01490 family)